jgi:outer membrane receptor protein involved in Fe transport
MIRHLILGRGGVLAALLLLVALLTSVPALQAQEIWATVVGTVVDAQGAPMAGVAVTVQNVDTNISTKAQTDVSGSYRVSKLQPGRYRIRAAVQGFKTYVRDGIVLRTAETGTVDVVLSLGDVAESITISADLSAAESNQSTLAQTMENKRVSELPLNGRQVYMLLQQTAGTLFTQTQFGAQGFSGTRAWDVNGSVSIHGSRTGNNEFLIDGGAIAGTGGWSYAPPVDAIEEFKVQTASTDASYGRTSGGVVNLTLRSGTNKLRGSGVLLLRGTALDANTIQNIDNGISNEGHKYVNGEFTLSGPIQKDKTFFMIGYQGFREDIPFPATSTVFTDLERQGDFSQSRNSAGQPITIYDPLTTRPDPARPGRYIRDPFPGNRIPRDRMNPISLALIEDIPSPNAAGDGNGFDNFINSPNLGFYRYNSYLLRLDHRFNPDHRISLSHSSNWGTEKRSENGMPAGPALRSDNWPTSRNSYFAVVDDVLTLDANTVLNTRVSFDRFNEPHPKEFGALGSTQLPFQTAFQVTDEPTFPGVTFPDDDLQDLFARGFRQVRNDIYTAQTSLSKTFGAHFGKAGVELRNYRLLRNDTGDSNGNYRFNGGFTQRDPQQGDGTSGAAAASFLLGLPSQATVDVNAFSMRDYRYVGLYVQDEWKINSKATLILGLRWDYQAPVVEEDDKLVVGFDTTTPSPLQVPLLDLRGGLLYGNVDGNSRSPYKGDWNNFQPRASLSYEISSRVVGRANYGRSFLPLTGAGSEGIIQNGFSQQTSMVTSVQTGIPYNTFSNPFPEGFLQPVGSSLGLATGIGTTITYQNTEYEVPYTDQWMAGVRVDLPWQLSLDVAYVGNRVSKLPVARSMNEVSRAEREKGIEALGGNASYLSTQLPNPFAGKVPGTSLNNPTVSRQQLLRPYPQFTGITMNLDNVGHSSYNALETVITKRLSKGFVGTVNYTLSRLKEATAFLNNGFDAEPFEDLATIDRTHHLTVSALYELPFRGSRLAEGWQINLLYEIASGVPVAMPNGYLRQESAKLPSGQQTRERWFDNSTRTNPRADGTWAWDTLAPNEFRVARFRMPDVRENPISTMAISVFKSTRVGQTTVQLRGELFNPLNSRYYGGPDTGITSGSFGRISESQFNFPRQGQLGVRVIF